MAVPNDKQILWSSERDGWDQLYTYDASTGKLESQVTHGSWVVRGARRAEPL
jgi:dipeptidyl-peptidase-4